MVFFQNRDKGWAGQICISLEISRKKVKKEKFRGLLKGSSVGVKTKSNKIKQKYWSNQFLSFTFLFYSFWLKNSVKNNIIMYFFTYYR